jgi:hypothetical protein
MSLAQIFVVTQPLGGISVVTISSVSLYFKSINQTMGIDVQIREVANGMPTYNIVENSRVTVRPTDKYSNGSYILKTSSDGSVPSTFTFLKPVQLKSLSRYSLMIIPNIDSANNGYVLWGATANGIDQSTKVPIQFNGAVGSLITWDQGSDRTTLSNQALKFSINKGFAINPRYHDDSYNFNEEHIVVNDFTNPFTIGESCYMSNSNLNLVNAQIFPGLLTGSFINGEYFYQTLGGGLEPITGQVYYANSSVLLLYNTSNTVSNTINITGNSSGANAWIGNINTSVVCSTLSNTISVPFVGSGSTNMFYANQSIFLVSSDLTKSQPFIVTSVNPGNNSIQVSWKPLFSDSNCLIGTLRGDNLSLKMDYQGYDSIKQNNMIATFNNSTANTQINQYFHFANSEGRFIIGQSSRARCMSFGTIDLEYHCVIPQLHFDQIEENEHKLYWGGYRSYNTFQSSYPNAWRYITEI